MKYKHILFFNIFLFSVFFWKLRFSYLWGDLAIWKFQKNKSEKLSMLKQKKGQFWNLHEILKKITPKYFQFSFHFSDDGRISMITVFNYFEKILIVLTFDLLWKYFIAPVGVPPRTSHSGWLLGLPFWGENTWKSKKC